VSRFRVAKRGGAGRKALTHDKAKSDGLRLDIVVKNNDAKGWNADLGKYLDRWPDQLAPVEKGPGTVGSEDGDDGEDTLEEDVALDATPLEVDPSPSSSREK
jgi:hypothetical protein